MNGWDGAGEGGEVKGMTFHRPSSTPADISVNRSVAPLFRRTLTPFNRLLVVW